MKIAVIGAAGGVGLRVVKQAVAAGHQVAGLVRKPEQLELLRGHGAQGVLGDLQGDWQEVLSGAEAVVWAAGASGCGDYEAIDKDALIAAVDVLEERGPRRLVVVSSLGVSRPDTMPPFLAAVLRLKAQSDAHVQRSDLDWTIVRPGGLTDGPATGHIAVAEELSGSISREDVAAVVVACLAQPATIRQTFEVVAGEQSIESALAGLNTTA